MARLRPARLRVRHVVTALLATAAIGLTVGPVRAATEPDAAPDAAPAAVAAPKGPAREVVVWDSTAARSHTVPDGEWLATATEVADAHVVVTGAPEGRALRGVGVVVTDADVAAAESLGPRKARLVRDGLTAADGAALRLDPDGRATRAASPRGADVADVLARELAPVLTAPRGPVASTLFSTGRATGLFDVRRHGIAPTTRGLVWSVAAHAVAPGSRTLPVTTANADGLAIRAFLRPDGGGALLVWNPGASRDLVVDVPWGDGFQRFRITLAAGAVSAVVTT